jgi:hypothetical protein
MPTRVTDQQTKKFKFGIRNTHPVGIGEEVWDMYFNDGTGSLAMGVWCYEPPGVWVLIGAGGGVDSIDVDSSGVPLTGDVNMQSGAGIALAKVGQNIVVNATGGGGGLDEKVDKYHDVVPLVFLPVSNNVNTNGLPSQRVIGYADDSQYTEGIIYKVWRDGYDLHLTLEKHANINGQPAVSNIGGQQQEIYDWVIVLQDWNENPLTSMPDDFCLVIDPVSRDIHIFFIDTNGDVWDAALNIVGTPPPNVWNMSLTAWCAKVNQNQVGSGSCRHVSAAWQSGYMGDETVSVAWVQMVDGTPGVIANHFDPATYLYTTWAEVLVSTPNVDADYPTVEVNNTGSGILPALIHYAWVEDNSPQSWHIFYRNETQAQVWSNIYQADQYFGAPGTFEFHSPPTMVVVESSLPSRDSIYVMICALETMNNMMGSVLFSIVDPNQGNNSGYVTLLDYYGYWTLPYRKGFYQLGCTNFTWSVQSNQPKFLLYHATLDDLSPRGGGSGSYHLLLSMMGLDDALSMMPMPWCQTTIRLGLYDIDNDLSPEPPDNFIYGFRPKVYFGRPYDQYQERQTGKIWYPPSSYLDARVVTEIYEPMTQNMTQRILLTLMFKDIHPHVMEGEP